jgi:hypothetical protein
MLMVASALALPSSGVETDVEDRWGPGFMDEPEYIIVAPADWEDTLQPLIDWRSRTTLMEPVFVSLEEAMSNGTGHDRAARLKESVKTYWKSEGLGHDHALLLVGDAEVLPVRWVFTDILQDGNVLDPLNFRWTDDYYAYGTESEWDKDGDGIYGEDGEVLDGIANAFGKLREDEWQVGRIPASTELELERYIDKVLAYERSPPPGDWYTSALVVSGLMDVPNFLDNPYTPDLDGGYELFSDNSYESHTKLQSIIPDRYDRTWLYDYPKLEGGDWNRSIDILDHESMVSAFDTGHSIMAMNGHGWIDGSGLAHYNGSGYSNYWWDWHNAYDYSDAQNASNGGRLPFAYVAACYVGDVTIKDDKTLERLVMNPDGGAIAMVAGNGENYKGESMANASYGNWFLERNFWTFYFQQGPGRAMHLTKQAYLDLVSGDNVPHTPLYDAYYIADYLSHNLLGDPLVRVWTDVPKTFGIASVEDDEAVDDAIVVTVTDDEGEPVYNATVHVSWDDSWTRWHTDVDGVARLGVPLDAGQIQIVVSADNFLPAIADMERPVTAPDLEVTDITWRADSTADGEPTLLGEELTLMAQVVTNGRYDFDQARVRFTVAPEGGDYERLVPDVFVAIWTGATPVAETTWTPPWPGTWKVRAEVNPAGELEDASIMNNFAESFLRVQGPPRWVTLPDQITMHCEEYPGLTYDLQVHVTDPDTSPEALSFTAEAIGQVPEGVRFVVLSNGYLRVCSDAGAVLQLSLVVSDGAYNDTTTLTVVLTRTPPRLRLVGETFHTLTESGHVTGSLSIENLGPGEMPEDIQVRDVSGNPLFTITPEGEYAFNAALPGTYLVRVTIETSDGWTEPSWEPAILVFSVLSGPGLPPLPYEWTDLNLVAEERATVHLQAVDLEGGTITYSLADDGGLGASIDPVTGMLTLDPGEGDVGDHTLVVRLSDGLSEDEYELQVYVTEAPSSGTALWIIAGLGLVLVGAVVAYLYLRSKKDTE